MTTPWTEILEGVREGRVKSAYWRVLELDDRARPTRMSLNLIAEFRSETAMDLMVGIDERLLTQGVPDTTQSSAVDLLLDAAGIRPTTGFITIDHVGHESPYDSWVGRNRFEANATSDELLRGYYWANLLSARHLEKLGGMRRVLAEAPAFRREEVGSDLALLQLTETINSVTDDDLCALREFLMPILPRRTRGMYFGPKLRLVEDGQCQ